MNEARGELIGGATQVPYLRLPDARVFSERADRFTALAERHALAEYLRFLAAICRAQHIAFTRMPTPSLPSETEQARALQYGMPLLNAQSGVREGLWREVLRAILDEVAGAPLPDAARAALARLRAHGAYAQDALADRLLNDSLRDDGDLAAAPLVGAALQVYWARSLIALGPDIPARPDPPGLCPVCGSPPVASRVRIGPEHGLRYAVCSLCQAEWNVVRIKCVHCASTAGIAYYAIGERSAIKAESCDACGTYLKIMYMTQAHDVDPVADDVASLSLDILMAEEGKTRYGGNFFLQTNETVQQEHDAHHDMM